MVRQGNTNEKVYLYRYVTEGTFDAYNYQILENKQVMVKQIMTSKSPARSCEDVDESVLDLATIKALCTGNPLIKERMDLEIDIARLTRLQSNHRNAQFKIENDVYRDLPPKIEYAKKRIENIQADIAMVSNYPQKLDEKGETVFSGMTVCSKHFDDKTKAGEALLDEIRKSALAGKRVIGEYKGFKITSFFDVVSQKFMGTLTGKADYTLEFGGSATGNIVRIDNLLNTIESQLEATKNKLSGFETSLESAKKMIGQPFAHEQELKEKQARLSEVIKALDKASETDTITDPYYVEISESVIPAIEESGIAFEVKTVDEKMILTVDSSNSDKVNAIINNSNGLNSNNSRPKLP